MPEHKSEQVFMGGVCWLIIKIGHTQMLTVMQRRANFTNQACEIMRYGCLGDSEVMPKQGVVMTRCRAGQGSHPCLLMV